MSDAKIRRITKLMNELNADGDVKNSGLESAYTSNAYAVSTFVQTTHTGNVSITGNTSVTGNITVTGNTSVTDTIQDAQGNVRALERNTISSTPYVIESGSSGKYFSLASGSANINFDTANVSAGDIMTFYNHQSSNANFNFTGMNNGVYIAGDTTDKTGGGLGNTLVFSPKGVATVICDATGRLIFNGNVE